MNIPFENLQTAVLNFKQKLKLLYKLEQRGCEYEVYYNELYKEITSQEKVFESFFGTDFIQKITDEAWLEYTENL